MAFFTVAVGYSAGRRALPGAGEEERAASLAEAQSGLHVLAKEGLLDGDRIRAMSLEELLEGGGERKEPERHGSPPAGSSRCHRQRS